MMEVAFFWCFLQKQDCLHLVSSKTAPVPVREKKMGLAYLLGRGDALSKKQMGIRKLISQQHQGAGMCYPGDHCTYLLYEETGQGFHY